MAGNYAQLLDIINNPTEHGLPAWDNNAKQIEGETIQQYLLSIINSLTVGYQFIGVATPSTSPGTPDQNVFYIGGAGTYANFGTSITVRQGQICVFIWNGSWTNTPIEIANSGFVNVNDVNGQSTEYETASAGRSAVPTAYRKSGLNITYLLSTGWVIEQFIGDDVSNWGVADNWKTIGPVSSTRNADINANLLNIGGNTNTGIYSPYVKRTIGKVVSQYGNLIDATDSYAVTDYFYCVIGTIIRNPYPPLAYSYTKVAFYDSELNFISAIGEPGTDDVTLTAENIPSNAVYCRANINPSTGYINTIQPLALPTVIDEIEKRIALDNYAKMPYVKSNSRKPIAKGFVFVQFKQKYQEITVQKATPLGNNGEFILYLWDGSSSTSLTLYKSESTIIGNKYFWYGDTYTIVFDFDASGTFTAFGTTSKTDIVFQPKCFIGEWGEKVAKHRGFFLDSDGTIRETASTSYAVTDYIYAKPGVKIENIRGASTGDYTVVLFYNEKLEYISRIKNTTALATITLTAQDIPSGAKFLKAGVDGATGSVVETQLSDLNAMIEILSASPSLHPLYGKKYASLGASTSTYPWHKNAVEENEMVFSGYGLGGASWALTADSALDYNYKTSGVEANNVMMNQIAKLFKDADDNNYNPDFITFLCGLNDCYSPLPSGNTFENAISADLTGLTPVNWFTDAPLDYRLNTVINMRAGLEFVSKKFPNAQIVVVTYQKVSHNSFNQTALAQLYELEKQIANWFSFPIVDFWSESGLSIPAGTIDVYSNDGLHPNGAGNILWKKFYSNKIKITLSART